MVIRIEYNSRRSHDANQNIEIFKKLTFLRKFKRQVRLERVYTVNGGIQQKIQKNGFRTSVIWSFSFDYSVFRP